MPKPQQELRRIDSNEIAITVKGLIGHLTGNKAQAKVFDKFSLPDPITYKGEYYENGGVKFRRATTHIFIVWCFKENFLSKVAKHSGCRVKSDFTELSKTEIALSGSSLGKIFSGKRPVLTKKLADTFKLPDPETEKKEILTVEGVKFYKRLLNSGDLVWAIAESDIQEFAKKLGASFKSSLEAKKDDEHAFNAKTLEGLLRSTRKTLSTKLNNINLPDPKISKRDFCDLDIGGDVVQFKLRQVKTRIYWCFSSENLTDIAKLLNVELRDPVNELETLAKNDFAISTVSLRKRFIETPLIRQDIKGICNVLGVPLPSSSSQAVKVKLHNIDVLLTPKLNSGKYIWTCDARHEELIAQVFQTRKKSDVRGLMAGEISIATNNLCEYFVGTNETLKARFDKEFNLPHEPENTDSEVSFEIAANTLTFFARRNVAHDVWAINEQDLSIVASVLDAKLKIGSHILYDPNIAEAVSLLGSEPRTLLKYLRVFHPEISIASANEIALEGFLGLTGGQDRVDYRTYPTSLEELRIDTETRIATKENTILIQGENLADEATHVVVEGSYHTKIKLSKDRPFALNIPLAKKGELNTLKIFVVNDKEQVKSEPVVVEVLHQGKVIDEKESFNQLLELKESRLRGVTQDPERYDYLFRELEISLLGKFTESEKRGFNHLASRIKNEKAALTKKMLMQIQDRFQHIADFDYGIQEGEKLYFYQKYKIFRFMEVKRSGVPAFLDSSEQGLGKTVTALLFSSGSESSIICPNAVVSNWLAEEKRFVREPSLVALEGDYKSRDSALQNEALRRVVTNIEYTRNMNLKRSQGLSRKDGTLIIDEADYLGSKKSQQAAGSRELGADFKLLLTATPFRRVSQLGPILTFLYPEDPRFDSTKSFSRVFDSNSPRSLDALHILLEARSLRILKEDIFKTYEISLPLERQKDRLPSKRKIQPAEFGEFELANIQCESILELISDYQTWCEKHKGHESISDQGYHRFNEGFFSKRESLRQIMNSPAYIGHVNAKSPKHAKMKEIIEHELHETKSNKVLIFCRYREQVEEYQKLFSDYGARLYYGGLKSDADGYKIDESGNRQLYRVKPDGKFELIDGKPVLADNPEDGLPMKSLDYEEKLFQNDQDSRVMIATYDAGAVGVTLTAANAVVFDDLAQTYRDEYQASDRAHRIDNLRKKYEVRYYYLMAKYPNAFLKKIAREHEDLLPYFKNGTYDEVFFQHLRKQERRFHRVMDVIGADDLLENAGFIKKNLPFLFEMEETYTE